MVFISTLMLMLLLCGCRTRITNNTEVGNVLTDENGILQESYQVRRDELGIPVAEAPLFKGTGSDDEEYTEYDEDYDLSTDDKENEYEEPDVDVDDDGDDEEDDSTTNTRNQNNTTNTTPVRRPSQQIVRRPSNTTQQTTTTTVRVTLDPNGSGAKCSRTVLLVKKGSTYGSLPTPTRSGYNFNGWYTAKTKGNKVTSKTKVTTDKAHTLYAQWTEVEKKTYTVTFDGNGEEDEVTLSSSEMTVTEGGKYGDMPSAKREKYSFKGWYTDPSGGSQITAGSKFTANENQTLYAHWEKDAYNWWKGEFDKAANEIDSDTEVAFLIDDESEKIDFDKAESFMKDCKTHKADAESTPEVIIKFINDYDTKDPSSEAEDLYNNKYSEIAPDAKIIIVSREAVYTDNKELKLLYKLSLLSDIYPSGYDLYEAEMDLHEGKSVGHYAR